MTDPLDTLRRSACTKLADVFGGWAFKPALRTVRAAEGRPPADVFQRSLDDKTLLSARFEGRRVFIDLVDVTDGRLRLCLERPSASPHALCWDAAGDTMLLANRDASERMSVEIITLSSGKTRALTTSNDVRYVALLAEGRYAVTTLLAAGVPVTRVYNLERGTALREWSRAVADLSPGAIAVSHVPNGVLRWCPLDGEELGVIASAPDHPWRSRSPLALHPDEATFAGVDTHGNLCCVDETGRLQWSVPWPLSMDDWPGASLKWSDHGATLFAMSGHAFTSLRGHDGQPITGAGGVVAPSARGDATLFARPMGFLSDLRDPDVPLSQQRGHRGAVSHLAVSRDGGLVASSSETELFLWKAGAADAWSNDHANVAVAFASDDSLVTCGAFSEINVWNAATGESRSTVVIRPGFRAITDLSVSRDGRLAFVTGSALEDDKSHVMAVDLAAGFARWRWSCELVSRARLVEGSREVTASRAQGFVTQLALNDGAVLDEARVFGDFVRDDGDFFFVHAGKRALCLGGSGWPLRLLDMRTGEVCWERADPGCDAPRTALSDDGRWFALTLRGALAGVIQLRAIETGAIVDQIDLRPLHDRPTCVAFSGDGRVLAVGTLRGVVLRFDCSAL